MDTTHLVLGVLSRLQNADNVQNEAKKILEEISEGMTLCEEGGVKPVPNHLAKKGIFIGEPIVQKLQNKTPWWKVWR